MPNNKYQKEMYVQDLDTPNNLVVSFARKHPSADAILHYSNLIQGEIADIGCDHAAFTLIAAENPNVTKAVGVDICPQSLERFEKIKKYADPKIGDKVSMVCSDVLDLDKHFKENEFDTVLTFHMLEHIYLEDIDLVMCRMKQILKPNGYLIISIPFENLIWSPNHVSFWNTISLRELFIKHDFDVYECFKQGKNQLTGAFKNNK